MDHIQTADQLDALADTLRGKIGHCTRMHFRIRHTNPKVAAMWLRRKGEWLALYNRLRSDATAEWFKGHREMVAKLHEGD